MAPCEALQYFPLMNQILLITTTNSMYLCCSRFWKCCSCAHACYLWCL